MNQHLQDLHQERERWEQLLSRLSADQLTQRVLPGNLSVKDMMAHLMIWQKRTAARLEAALKHTEPASPPWPSHLNGDTDQDQINAWTFETHRDRTLEEVVQLWRQGYQRILDMSSQLSEQDLTTPNKYHWLEGFALEDLLRFSYEHHHFEHYEQLHQWLVQHGWV